MYICEQDEEQHIIAKRIITKSLNKYAVMKGLE